MPAKPDAYRAGETVFVGRGDDTFEPGVLVTNAKLEGRTVYATVALNSGHHVRIPVTSIHRDSPAFQAWRESFIERKIAYAALKIVLDREGYTFGGAASLRTPEGARYEAASSAISRLGAAAFAIHPYRDS